MLQQFESVPDYCWKIFSSVSDHFFFFLTSCIELKVKCFFNISIFQLQVKSSNRKPNENIRIFNLQNKYFEFKFLIVCGVTRKKSQIFGSTKLNTKKFQGRDISYVKMNTVHTLSFAYGDIISPCFAPTVRCFILIHISVNFWEQ